MFLGNLDPSSKALGGEVKSGIQDSGVDICLFVLQS